MRRRRGPGISGGTRPGRAAARIFSAMTLLKNNELLEKLTQIHEQAELTLGNLPKGLVKDRLQRIFGLEKYRKNALELAREPKA